MGRPSRPYRDRSSGKWRFHWSVESETRQACTDACADLRQLTTKQKAKLRPSETQTGFCLSWAVVRSLEADIWAEFARYTATTKAASDDSPTSVSGLISLFLREKNNESFASWSVAALKEYAGPEFLSNIKPNFLERFRRWLKSQTIQQKDKTPIKRFGTESIKKQVGCASTLFKNAYDEGWIERRPRTVNIKSPEPKPKAYSRVEVAGVIRSLKTTRTRHIIKMIRMMYVTGMRPGEARRLQWNQIDTARKAITIHQTDHKTGERTGKIRIVYLSSKAVRLIQSLTKKGPYLFVSRTGKPYTEDGLHSILWRRGISPYRLRHTFAQRAIDADIPPHLVTKLLGHETSSMVWTYAKIRSIALKNAVAQLEVRPPSSPSTQDHHGSDVVADSATPPARKVARR